MNVLSVDRENCNQGFFSFARKRFLNYEMTENIQFILKCR